MATAVVDMMTMVISLQRCRLMPAYRALQTKFVTCNEIFSRLVGADLQ